MKMMDLRKNMWFVVVWMYCLIVFIKNFIVYVVMVEILLKCYLIVFDFIMVIKVWDWKFILIRYL